MRTGLWSGISLNHGGSAGEVSHGVFGEVAVKRRRKMEGRKGKGGGGRWRGRKGKGKVERK